MIKQCGIYKIICIPNNKIYIGSSIDINRRLMNHISLLKHNKHLNKYLQKSWNKYGKENFKFEIIEIIYKIDNLLIREKWWLDNTQCYKREMGFNISSCPHSHPISKFIDLIGQKFNKLTVIEYVGNGKWKCRCDCGNIKIIIGYDLKRGHTKSCGCFKIEKAISYNTKHGYTSEGKMPKIYYTWQSMIRRCTNPNCKDYKKHITICNTWNPKKGGSFKNFCEDIGEPPTLKHQLGRINTNLGYFKENCHWVLCKRIHRNRKNNILITFNGETHCLIEWSEILKISYGTLRKRIFMYKWSIEKAFTIPTRKYKK